MNSLKRELLNFNISPETLYKIQEKYSKYIIKKDYPKKLKYIAGVDCSYKENIARCAIVVMNYPDLAIIEWTNIFSSKIRPYIPGCFVLREGPLILKCWERLKIKPDYLIIHSHGIAHPRKFGMASHIGLILDIPTIGCAEKLLCGRYRDSRDKRIRYLVDENNDVIGASVYTKKNAKPIIISIGHKISLNKAIEVVLQCIKSSKLPEPLRIAHIFSNSEKKWGRKMGDGGLICYF